MRETMNLRVFVLRDRKSTRLNSSHLGISYAVFCLKKKIRHSGARNAEGRAPASPEFRLGRVGWRNGGDPERPPPGRGPRPRPGDQPLFFFFNDPAPPEFYPFPLPAPLPI